MVITIISCTTSEHKTKTEKTPETETIDLTGSWVRMSHLGPVSIEFTSTGHVKTDFGNDNIYEVISDYQINNDTITFIDKEGYMCENPGRYIVKVNNYYASFNLIDDECHGRLKTTLGFWTKQNFKELITELDNQIDKNPDKELFLKRARIYMSVGMTQHAKTDLSSYILLDSTNPRAFLNRAATYFPDSLKNAITDCNKSITLNPSDKNAYFLLGLAQYETGNKEEACRNFKKAIKLGFSILAVEEYEKCSEFWN